MKVTLRELTAPQRGAVAVVEVCGEDAARFVSELSGKPPPPPGQFALRNLRTSQGLLDEALVVTRSDGVVELHLHGGESLVAQLCALAPSGAAPSAPVQALIAARTDSAARIALDQHLGVDEALPSEPVLRERLRCWQRLATPARILLSGPVNAGKSTLFNALVGSERALVSPLPGTTRDLVREEARLGPWPVLLIDSAGLRATNESVEQAGQERVRELLAEGGTQIDWVLWVDPRADGGRNAPPGAVWIRSQSKSSAANAVQALEQPEQARARIRALFEASFALPSEPWQPGSFVPLSESDLRRALDSGKVRARS